MRKYLKGMVDDSHIIGSLATRSLSSQIFDDVVDERTLITSLEVAASLAQWSPTQNTGPVRFGVAHSDYSDNEIEAYLETTDSWSSGDLIANEIARRKIRTMGVFDNPPTLADIVTMWDGAKKKFKLNWILNTGQTLRMWSYNEGTVAIVGNPIMKMSGHANLFVL